MAQSSGSGEVTGVIDSRQALEAWLRDKPVGWAQTIAVRAALRVLPLVATVLDEPDDGIEPERKKGLILHAFRAGFISWVARKYTTYEVNTYAASTSAASASAASAAADARTASAFRAVFATSAASAAATSTASADAAASARTATAAYTAASAAAARTATYRAVIASASASASADEVLASIEADRRWLESNRDGVLIDQPLWLEDVRGDERFNANFPIWVREPFDRLNESDLVTTGPWGLWIAWYRAILPTFRDRNPSSAWHERRDVRIATKPADFWRRDPDVVMADIADIVGWEWPNGPTEVEIEAVREELKQRPAPFRFSASDGPIDILPESAIPNDTAFAEVLLNEAWEKARELLERLNTTNAAARVRRTTERILEVLPQQLSELNPALLRSKTRSLEADCIAFASAGAEAELFPEAVSQMVDLAGTLKDLQSSFPVVVEIEREAAKIEIAGREKEAAAALSDIADKAKELASDHPELVTAEAAAAVAILQEDIDDAATAEVQSDLIASSALTARNFLAAAYTKLLTPAGREAARVAGKYYNAVIDGSAEGLKDLSKKGPLLLVAYYLGGPMLAAAAVFASFKTLKNAQDIVDKQAKESSEKDRVVNGE